MPASALARHAAVPLPAAPARAAGADVASPLAPPDARPQRPLTALGRHARGIVAGVRVPAGTDGGPPDPAVERIALRLIEIGFVEGEHLQVIAFGQPGQDPIGVRIGGRGGVTSFALRRQEAACVWVWPDAPA